jgi:PPOX class probable F420-dependent enzyme
VEKRYAVLGTRNPSGSPHLTAMWYLLDGDEILFNTADGRAKPRNIALDPRVSFIVVDPEGYPFVRIDGRVRTIDDPAATQTDIRRIALRYYEDEARVERAMRENFSKQRRISYRLPILRVYAARR